MLFGLMMNFNSCNGIAREEGISLSIAAAESTYVFEFFSKFFSNRDKKYQVAIRMHCSTTSFAPLHMYCWGLSTPETLWDWRWGKLIKIDFFFENARGVGDFTTA